MSNNICNVNLFVIIFFQTIRSHRTYLWIVGQDASPTVRFGIWCGRGFALVSGLYLRCCHEWWTLRCRGIHTRRRHWGSSSLGDSPQETICYRISGKVILALNHCPDKLTFLERLKVHILLDHFWNGYNYTKRHFIDVGRESWKRKINVNLF